MAALKNNQGNKLPKTSKPDPSEKIARYTLVGTLGAAVLSALAQIVVAWLQRH
jgi:hypothetical protein